MQLEDRPIHFSTELVFAPRKFEKSALQKFYYDLTQIPGVGYDNSQFGINPLARFDSKRGAKSQSILVVIPDRIGMLEEWVAIPFSDFITKIETIGPMALNDLGISAYHTQTVMLRTTFGLSHFEDNRVFLLDHVCAQESKIGPFFQRPVGTGSLRFVLPATPDHEGTLYITIEPFRESKREIFVEVRGVFSSQQSSLKESSDFSANAFLCRDFINASIFPYLNQYDVPQTQT
jgi:hypothetical protein